MNAIKNSHANNVEYLPLTPGQKWLMGDMLKYTYPGWVTIECLVKTKESMDESMMEKALYHVLGKHESLRVKLYSKEGEWVQEVYSLSQVDVFSAYDFSNENEQRKTEKLRQVCIKTRDWL